VTSVNPNTASGTKRHYRLLNMVDGGALSDLAKKGVLSYVEELYNPGNFFSTVYHVVFKEQDLSVPIRNRTIKVLLLKRTRHVPKIEFLINLIYYVIQIIRIPRKYGIDVIRARGPYMAGFLSLAAGKLNGIPVVVSLGGDHRLAQQMEGEYFLHNRLLSWKWEEFVLRNADRVFCPNEFTRNYVKNLGVKDAQAVTVPFLPTERVFHQKGVQSRIRRKLGWRDQPIVLAVARLTPYKQVDVLVDTIPLILKAVPRAKFVFLGGGPLMNSLAARCRELKITNSVRFEGFQPTDQVINYLAAASIVWIPMSGFGVLEAAAAGKPIVAFDVDWHKEFIENNVSGVLVRNRDRAQLAGAIIDLLRKPSKARRLGRNAEAKVRRYYDPRKLVDLETEIYKTTMRGHHKQ